MIDEVDYVVVGAGSAGCVLANRLSEDTGCTVAVLEAGGGDGHPLVRMPVGFLQALQRPSLTWRYESEPEPQLDGRRIPIPRGRVLGGSSSINGMFHIRGHHRDFDEWAALGCTGWGYREVLPYFIRSESNWRGAGDFHGGDGPLQVRAIDTRHLLAEPLRAAAERAGYAATDDYDGPRQEGIARGDVAIDARGRRSSTARAYLHPVRNRRNLHVVTQAAVQRVVIVDGRAVGVEYRRDGQLQTLRARREVILSGGAYNSPQLLMLSGIGPAAELRELGITVHADLPGVGRNLIEHPRMPLQFQASQPVTFMNQLRIDRAAMSVLRWALLGSGPFATQICSGTILLRTRPDLDRPDIQLLCNPVRVDASLWVPGLVPAKPHSFYITVCQLHAKSRGEVTLRSANAADAPRIRLGIFSHPDDIAGMRAGIRAARAIYAQTPQAELIASEMLPGGDRQSDADLDRAIRELGGITHHPVGTCAMGVGPEAVVDPELRVRGIRGLRVADASVMPTIPGANTNAATIMIGEKASDLIRGRSLPAAAPSLALEGAFA